MSIRKVPHLDGNFASYFFLQIDYSKELNNLQSLIKSKISDKLDDNVQLNETEINNFHLSLSKTFYLNLHQIDSFLKIAVKGSLLKNFFFFISINFFFFQFRNIIDFLFPHKNTKNHKEKKKKSNSKKKKFW